MDACCMEETRVTIIYRRAPSIHFKNLPENGLALGTAANGLTDGKLG